MLAFGGLEAVFLWPLVLGLYWERANAKGAKCDDRWRRAVCRTRDAEYSVPGLPPYRALVTTKFAGFPGRKPFRYIRPASYRFDY
ncbi:sodium:solute symporter family transporter [Escherichia coli]